MDIVKSAKEKAAKIGDWVDDHILDICGGAALLAVGGVGSYGIWKAIQTVEEYSFAIYDKKNDWFCGCKRQVSNEEMAQILKICRKKHCSITEVLADMDLRTNVYSIEK